jgi:hypothetical protein
MPPPEDPAVVEKRRKKEEVVAKFRSKLREILDPEKNGMNEYAHQSAEAATEARKLAEKTAQLTAERSALDAEIAGQTKRYEDIARFVADADSKGPQDVDTASDSSDVHRTQLVRTVSLDMALEDVLYNLDRALIKAIIPLDDYLKLYRNLANEQFFARALIKKIRETIVEYQKYL